MSLILVLCYIKKIFFSYKQNSHLSTSCHIKVHTRIPLFFLCYESYSFISEDQVEVLKSLHIAILRQDFPYIFLLSEVHLGKCFQGYSINLNGKNTNRNIRVLYKFLDFYIDESL